MDATRQVRAAIRAADDDLVQRYPFLGRDDGMAVGFFLLAWGGSAAICVGWWMGQVPAWLAIVGLAFTISILHEMEHDLIHDLYLPHPVVRPLVLLSIWLAKGSLDPWTRGSMHLWHHIVSGQDEDIEERLIGLGLPWGPLRVLITLAPPVSIVLRPRLRRAVRARAAAGGRRPDPRAHSAPWPLFLGNAVLFLLPLVVVLCFFMEMPWARPCLVLWVLPNVLRHGSIATLSSSSHYVAIKRGVVAEQNQILDHPMFWPLAIFSWNFGATHVMHHFLVNQPFWRRTLTFSAVREVMVENGVRANDLGTFRRANRYA